MLSRLTLKLYAASVGQLLMAVAFAALMGWIAFNLPQSDISTEKARYALTRLTPHMSNREQLRDILLKISSWLNVDVAVYRLNGKLIASNVQHWDHRRHRRHEWVDKQARRSEPRVAGQSSAHERDKPGRDDTRPSPPDRPGPPARPPGPPPGPPPHQGSDHFLPHSFDSEDGRPPPPRPVFIPVSKAQRAELRERGELQVNYPMRLLLLVGDKDQPLGYAVFAREHHTAPPPLVIWAVCAALVAGAVSSLLLTRTFVRPLRALGQAAGQLGAGDLSTRVQIDRRDEFGQVANAFNEMAQRLGQLVRSQQELLANVSHELRTPIARIRLALDLANEGDAELAQQMLGGIVQDLQELERLVDDVLNMARLDLTEGKAGSGLRIGNSPVLLDEVIEGAAERFAANHGPQRLELEVADSLPELKGNAMLLRRAVDNLLDNAAAYSPEDSTVTLGAKVGEAQIEIWVQDRGIGISKEDLQHIGTPFFRTDRSRARRTGGIGLGISLVRRITAAHGGTLVLESVQGQGTTAYLRFPWPQPLTPPAPPSSLA